MTPHKMQRYTDMNNYFYKLTGNYCNVMFSHQSRRSPTI